MSMERLNIWSWHGLPWSGLRPRDKANEWRTTLFAFLWVGSLIPIRAASLAGAPEWAIWLLGGASLLCGWLFARAFWRMLREADELMRQVQLEALAAGCGAGIICGLTFMAVLTPSVWVTLVFFVAMSFAYILRITLAALRATRDTPGDEE
ncbi:MAG TPA: hypothetical protein VLA37_09485 [Sphingomonadaceae bacterium]|nr:hypothetical protein [Sphingomonadaceae bacterium]